MTIPKCYWCLSIDQSHIVLIRKIYGSTDKSTQALLSMMMRKNKQAQQSIFLYQNDYKLKFTKPKTPPQSRKISSKKSKQRILRIVVNNHELKRPKENYKEHNEEKSKTISIQRIQRSKPVEKKQQLKPLSKLSLIQFPTYSTQFKFSSCKLDSTGSFMKNHFSSKSEINNTPLLSPSALSSQQQQLLLRDLRHIDFGQKQNKPTSIRIKTFKSHQIPQISRTSRQTTILKPLSIQKFFRNFQSTFNLDSFSSVLRKIQS